MHRYVGVTDEFAQHRFNDIDADVMSDDDDSNLCGGVT
jgi:hypothetical protein